MHRRFPYRSRRGLSLIEVIAALLIIAFSIAVFGAAFPTAANSINRNRHADQATDAAYQEIDAWRRDGYKTAIAPLLTSGNGATATPAMKTTLPTTLPSPTGSITFTRIDSSALYPAATNLATGATVTNRRAQAVCTITWTGNKADKGTVVVTTLITDY
jgi:prepilin-type N-terminal cleavage/methylation domain-containing protein